MSRRDVELGGRLRERDLIGPRIDSEKEITLPHDVAVLEKDPSERAAYLRAQLHLRDRRKLTKEAQLRVKVLYQRFAHHYFRECCWMGTDRTSTCATGISAPSTQKHYQCYARGHPRPRQRSPAALPSHVVRAV